MKFAAILSGCLAILPSLLVASAAPRAGAADTSNEAPKQLAAFPFDCDASNYTSLIKPHNAGGLERRQLANDIDQGVVAMLNECASVANGAGGSSDTKRGRFTQEVVVRGRQRFPRFNWILCHTSHNTYWQGTQGYDWQWRKYYLNGYGYDVNWARAGTFVRHGDGGFLNWAYSGIVSYRSPDGSVVEFRAP